VILAMELLAESLDRDQVAHAVSLVSLAGNFWDSELNKTFGGKTYFAEDPAPAAAAAPAGTPPAAPPAPAAPGANDPAGESGRRVEDPPAAGYI
jgi:hypothetical protein